MPTILDEIVARRRQSLATDKAAVPLSKLEPMARLGLPVADFAAALRGDRTDS